jgi:hypothetical protein
MKRMRILGLCLVAVFAVGVVSAATASAAEPGWYECAKAPKEGKTYLGKYSDKACTSKVESGGKYELQAGIGKGKAFKGKGGKAVLHNVIPGKGDIKVECQSFKDEGKVAAPNIEFGVKSTFSKCKSLGAPCKTAGGKKETITTETLAGTLGYLNKAGKVVGADLASESAPGSGYVAQFECEGVAKVRVHGSVIGTVTGDINSINKESTTTFAVGPYLGELSPGYTPLVNPPEFEGGSPDILLTELNGPETGNEWAPEGGLPSGQEGAAVNKGESLEIKA